MSPSIRSRIERDSLGERELPADVYYGIQTARAMRIFHHRLEALSFAGHCNRTDKESRRSR